MPVVTTARKAATKAVVRRVAGGVGSVALAAAETAAKSRTVRRLVVAQVAAVLFLALMVPVVVLGISTSVGPGGGEPSAAGPSAELLEIPDVALRAYVSATVQAKELVPDCTVRPSVLAAIFYVESGHGGGRLNDGGVAVPPIEGTDGSVVRRGPGNFSASTWTVQGLDGDGDGVADPQNIFDSASTSAAIVCGSAGGADLTSRTVLEQATVALGRENGSFVDDVLRTIPSYDAIFSEELAG